MIYFPLIFLEEKFGDKCYIFLFKNFKKNIAFFHVRKTESLMARSLNAAGALGLVLHYLNSTMQEISLQQIFCAHSNNGFTVH